MERRSLEREQERMLREMYLVLYTKARFAQSALEEGAAERAKALLEEGLADAERLCQARNRSAGDSTFDDRGRPRVGAEYDRAFHETRFCPLPKKEDAKSVFPPPKGD